METKILILFFILCIKTEVAFSQTSSNKLSITNQKQTTQLNQNMVTGQSLSENTIILSPVEKSDRASKSSAKDTTSKKYSKNKWAAFVNNFKNATNGMGEAMAFMCEVRKN